MLDWDSDQIISASASDQLIMIDVLAEPPNLKLVRVRVVRPFCCRWSAGALSGDVWILRWGGTPKPDANVTYVCNARSPLPVTKTGTTWPCAPSLAKINANQSAPCKFAFEFRKRWAGTHGRGIRSNTALFRFRNRIELSSPYRLFFYIFSAICAVRLLGRGAALLYLAWYFLCLLSVSVGPIRPAQGLSTFVRLEGKSVARHFGLSARSFLLFRRTVLALLLPNIFALLTVHAVAQVPGISIGQTFNGETATPIPGGHDYIHLLSETVNQSNGSLAFNIQLPVPKSRGISLPYTVMYNSAGLYHLGQDYTGTLTFVPTDLKASSLPWVSWSESSYAPVQITCPPGCNPPIFSQCNVANGFVFNDPSGTSHNLAIGVGATSANVGEPNGAEPCPVTGPGEVVPTGSGAGDGKVWAQFTSSGASGLSVTAVQHWSVNAGSNANVNGPVGPFTVTDEAGTTYFFGGNGTYDQANQVNWAYPNTNRRSERQHDHVG